MQATLVPASGKICDLLRCATIRYAVHFYCHLKLLTNSHIATGRRQKSSMTPAYTSAVLRTRRRLRQRGAQEGLRKIASWT